jgi:CBS domain-containing protein
MLQVKDVMTGDVITAGKDLSIYAAAELLVKHHITGVPIVDKDKNLIGILSEYDVLRILKETTPDQQKTIEDFMTKNVVTFEDTATLVEVWEFFIDNPTKRRVPIVRYGKLVGVVSRGDIVRQIVKIRHG